MVPPQTSGSSESSYSEDKTVLTASFIPPPSSRITYSHQRSEIALLLLVYWSLFSCWSVSRTAADSSVSATANHSSLESD